MKRKPQLTKRERKAQSPRPAQAAGDHQHQHIHCVACGKHLDPKTRNLISVITKVDAQTERGFRQYLGRALREGCTPMEVLDALLMAFPTLGLAKIVWAVDIILDMDVDARRGLAPEAVDAQVERWIEVVREAEGFIGWRR
jgi:alkylhydroperoxidase/carboxymuconolactone decarboxylase family protein YurZ